MRREFHNIEIYLGRGANYSGALKAGTPLLIYAIRRRDREIVRMLLEAGATVDVCDPVSRAPSIWFAAHTNEFEIASRPVSEEEAILMEKADLCSEEP